MQAVNSPSQERAAFDHVLESGLFEKAPRLRRFFCYVCELYFEGHADQIKEYSIATEALGRGADFDPKKDSIVRVEAHRLRRRLEEYYKGPGSDEELRIVIPNGQYRPHFVVREAQPETADRSSALDLAPVSIPVSPAVPVVAGSVRRPNRHYWARWAGAAGLAVVVLLLAIRAIPVRAHKPQAAPAITNEVWSGSNAPPAGPELRILAGYHGKPYIDQQGHTWYPDAYFRGGTSKQIDAARYIEAQPDPHLIRSARVGQFHYDIPLVQGTHEMHLFFVEPNISDPGSSSTTQQPEDGTRIFQLSINGEMGLTSVDPVADAGAPNRLTERVFKDVAASPDGKLHLEFKPGTGDAALSGIEILPSAAGKIQPIRIVAQPTPVTDSQGRLWAADEYFCGGRDVMRGSSLLTSRERALYRGERYGNFSYRIPLAPGKYRLTLHFAEQWFGTGNSEMAPVSNREFDVFANRSQLLHDFIVGTAAGGANRSVEKTFDNLQPNAQGLLLLEFVPISNYAEVNAIEVVSSD